MDLSSLTSFFETHKLALIALAAMIVFAFILTRLMHSLRSSSEQELERLRHSNPPLYLDRLQNNHRLNWVFRKNELLLLMLDAHMRLGHDEEVLQLIHLLDKSRLQPREKVDYLQKRMSYFASSGNAQQARTSFDSLNAYLRSVKADQVETYRQILEEGEEIIQVYIEKNLNYRKTLLAKVSHTQNPIQKGIRLYRLAKLSYLAQDEKSAQEFLAQCKPLLHNSDYEPIIAAAQDDLKVLSDK